MRLLIGILVIMLLAAGCVPGVVETTPAPTETASPTGTLPTTTTPELQPKSVGLDILSHSSYVRYAKYVSLYHGSYKGNFLHIVGEIQNPSSVSVRLGEDRIEANFYDAGGFIIDAGPILRSKFAEEEILPPGGKWPFRLILLDEEASQRVASYELLAKGYETTEMPRQAEVLSYGLFQNANLKLIGEVRNATSDNVNVRIIALFYDEKDTVITAQDFFAALVLRPGEKGPFWLLPVPTEAPGEIDRCELITRCEATDIMPYREFEVLNVVYQEGPEWSWDIIRGELKNIGEQSVTYIWVYATYYDAEGKVIDYSLSPVEPETLGPGETGSFELIAPSPPWQMPNYALLVKASPS